LTDAAANIYFYAPCINVLTYLLTYLLTHTNAHKSVPRKRHLYAKLMYIRRPIINSLSDVGRIYTFMPRT